jgi:hypothetical protein
MDQQQGILTSRNMKFYYYYLIELKMGFSRWQWYYNQTQHTKYTCHTEYHTNKTQAHKATQTIKDSLLTMNTSQKRKAIPVTGRGGL